MMLGGGDPETNYPAKGTILDGKYIVGDLLATGGMGAVVGAIHVLRRAPVALKFLNPKMRTVENALERFLREAVAASAVQTEHVVRVYDVGALPDGTPYLVMELLDGRDLAAVMRTEGKPGLPIPRAIHFTLQVLRALQAAHAIGVVHRDLKPSNCFVINHEGDRDFIKVLDFGVSKVKSTLESVLTRADSTVGTPVYMAPEQARAPHEVDARCDLYSVSVVLYRMLSGTLPYQLDNENTKNLGLLITRLLTVEVERIDKRVPDLPPGLADVVHRGLAREPNDRFQSAGEMAEALAPFADSRSDRVLNALSDFDPAGSNSHVYAGVETVLRSLGIKPGDGATPVSGKRANSSTKPEDLPSTAPPPPMPPSPAPQKPSGEELPEFTVDVSAFSEGGVTRILAPRLGQAGPGAPKPAPVQEIVAPRTPPQGGLPALIARTAASRSAQVLFVLCLAFGLSYVLVRFFINGE
jgi:serine/threonine-protein kinase